MLLCACVHGAKSEISLDTGFKAVRPQPAINILHSHM